MASTHTTARGANNAIVWPPDDAVIGLMAEVGRFDHLAERLGVCIRSLYRRFEQRPELRAKLDPYAYVHGGHGPANHNYRGGTTTSQGYRSIAVAPDHPLASMRDQQGRVMEHRLVMAEHLGRALLPAPQETVHHRNGDRLDNRLSNLQLRRGQHGVGYALRCQSCGSEDVEAVPL